MLKSMMERVGVMEIVATLLLLSIGAICCDGRENIASIVLVDSGRTSENISFAGSDQLDYTLQLKSEFNLSDVSANVVSIIDAGCSIVQPLQIANITTISCCRSYLTIRSSNLYTLVPSDELLVPGLLSVLNYHDWKLVTLFTENATQFNQLSTLVTQELDEAGIEIEEHKINSNATLSNDLFSGDAHVFVLNTDYLVGRNVLCEALNGKRYYPNYAWILLNWSIDQLRSMQLSCTQLDINVVLNRALVLVPYPNGEYEVSFDELYDALDYAADALQSTWLAYQSCNNFSVCNADKINSSISTVSFDGLTGHVEYSDNGRLASTILVLQYRELEGQVPIGVVSIDIQPVIRLWENETTIWPDGIPPDGTPIRVINILMTWVTVYGSILMSINITFAIVCFCFNFIFRKRKIVKLISPNLNYIMILGALMISISGFPIRTRRISTQTIDCVIDRLFSSLGYDICFGVALVKIFRVYYIFKITSAKKRVLQDWKLVLVVLGLVLGDIIIAHPLFVAGVIKGDVNFVKDLQTPSDVNNQGVRQEYYTISCGTTLLYEVYLVLTVLYKIVLHVIGLILAILTRKVEIDVLNDYKSTSVIVYCSSVTIVVLIVLASVLADNPNADEIGFATLLFVTVAMYLGLTFIPKMVALYKDPEGNEIFPKSANGNGIKANSSLTGKKSKSTEELDMSADAA